MIWSGMGWVGPAAFRPQASGLDDKVAGLRVLHVISYPQRMAGANRSLLEIVTHYPPEVTPLVVVIADGPVADAYRRAGVPVEIIPVGPALGTYGKAALAWGPLRRARVAASEALPFAWRIASLIRRRAIDLVHVNDPRGAALVGPVARLLRVPLVAHMHGARPFEGLFWRLFELLPDRILAVSNGIQSDLSPAARRKTVTVYNGLGDVAAVPGPKIPWLESLRAQGAVVVAVFASLVPFKGAHHLIDALARLDRKRIVAVWVGELVAEHAEYHDWLAARREALGVTNFVLAGWQADPMPFYRSADLTVLPSVSRETLTIGDRTVDVRGNEGLPMTHIEAMYHGLPVVGTAISGVPELIADGETGFVVPPGDAVALAGAIERLAGDPALRRQFGAAGRARAFAKFSTETQVAGVLAAYARVR